MTAVAAGAVDRMIHSPRNSAPLTTNDDGTSLDGATRLASRAYAMTRRMEHTELAIIIAGSVVKSSEVRNSASRVALPLTNCAVTAAEQSIAIAIVRGRVVMACEHAKSGGILGNAPNGSNPRKSPDLQVDGDFKPD